jgi:hypothetical protein
MPRAASKDDRKGGPSPRKLVLDETGDSQKRKLRNGGDQVCKNRTGKKQTVAAARKKRKAAAARNKTKVPTPSLVAVNDVAEYDAAPLMKKRERGKEKSGNTLKSAPKRSRNTPESAPKRSGSTAESAPKRSRVGKRQWTRLWFACEECVSCKRLQDCGKCGQCRNGEMGICILRQCITPVRRDKDVTSKGVLSDEESLEGLDSDLSDLEWEEAFPVEEFGGLTKADLLKRWRGKKKPEEPAATASSMPAFSI